MQEKKETVSPPDFIAFQVTRSTEGEPVWSSVLVGVAWRCPDGSVDVQFSAQPVTGLVKLRPHKA
jgi:hypothetical protein